MTTTQKPRFTFPISLDAAGRRSVVAGRGPLARQTAAVLGEAGAAVQALLHVVSDKTAPAAGPGQTPAVTANVEVQA